MDAEQVRIRQRVLAEHAPDWDYWVGPDGRYRYVSPACESVCGYPPEAFLADPGLLRSLLHPADRERWDLHLCGPNEGADPDRRECGEPIELRLTTRDGRQRWIEHRCQRVFDLDGRDLGRRGVNRDISRAKAAEEALARTSQLYATLVQLNQALLRAEDESALFAALCRIAVETGGLKGCVVSLWVPADAPGGTLTPVASAGIPADLVREMPLPDAAADARLPPAAAGGGRVEAGDRRAEAGTDGRWHAWARAAGVGTCCHLPFDRGGKRAGLASYLGTSAEGFSEAMVDLLAELTRDLSLGLGHLARRTAEQAARAALAHRESHLDALVRSAPVGIGTVRDRVYVEVNDRMCEMVGYARADLVGRSTRTIFPSDEEFRRVGEALYPMLARAGVGSLDIRLRRADGQIIDALLTSALLDRADPGQGVVSTLLDVTQARRAQALLEARVALAAAAAGGNLNRLLRMALEAAERLTESGLGFLHLLDPDGERLALQSWSAATLAAGCTAFDSGGHAPVSLAGVWADAVRQGAPTVHNDYPALAHRRGLPEGHAALHRELVVPVTRDGRPVAVLGVGNKPYDYTDADREVLEQLASMAIDGVDGLRAQEALVRANARLLEAQRLAGMGDWSVDLCTGQGHWSPEASAVLGLAPGTQSRALEAMAALIHPEDRPAFRADLGRAVAEGTPYGHDLRLLRPDGAPCHVRSLGRVERDAQGRPLTLYGIVQDITARKENEERLRQHARVFESTSEGVMITDAQGRILAVNQAFAAITGYAESEVLGRNPRLLASGRHDRDFYAHLWGALQATGQWRGEIWNRRKDGALFAEWLTISAVMEPGGQTTHYVAVFTDITHIKRSQERLDFLAHHDALTGLPNRLLFQDRLDHAIRRAQREGLRLALMFLDLDGFKGVNDTLGHAVGDRLLEVVAERLGKRLRASDTLARLGGDEFLIVLEGDTGAAAAAVAAEACLRLLAQPIHIRGHEIYISGSIGISLYPADAEDPETLLASADLAMYRAKADGRNTYHFYVPEMTASALERQALENALRGAVKRGELKLHYQVQVELGGRRPCGVEALARWVHPHLGLVPPGRFIPIAEGIGIVAEIDEWAVGEACRQLAAWRATGLPVPRVAVNCSKQALERGSLLPAVQQALAATGIPPEDLMLEVTEAALMGKGPRALAALADLRALGVRLALDDFGTGYSALGRLNRIPIDRVKVDASFIRDIGGDPKDEAVARALVGLGNDLGLEVLAEGVEHEEQVRFLIGEGCRYAQGYLFGVPAAPETLRAIWDEGPTRAGDR